MDAWAEDESLARGCLSGDEAAWRRLVDRHAPRVYAVCRAARLGEAEAQDVCQDVLLCAFRGLASFGGCRLSTWLYRITRRRIADHLRSSLCRVVAAGLPGDPGFPEAPASARPDPPAAIALAEEGDRLRRELDLLEEPTRSILIAYYFAEVPVADIADDMGLPENTVKSHLHRGRLALRRRLSESP